MNIEKMKIELEKKLRERTNLYIRLEMGQNKEAVYIEPKFNDIFYVYYNEVQTGRDYNNLTEVAKALCNYRSTIEGINEENNNYFLEQFPKLKEYFNKYIKGKSREEIEPDTLDFYSDWYKEVYGYRPRFNF